MHKRFWVIAVLFFLFAQSFSLWHAAESGFEPHQHHGKVCALYLHCEHQSFDSAAKPVAEPIDAYALQISATNPAYRFLPAHILHTNPRAPPVFS